MKRSVSQFIREMRERNRCQGYIEMVGGRLSHFANWMEEHGVTCLSGIGHEVLSEYIAESFKGKAASYQRYWWNVIKSFLRFHKHDLGEKYHYWATGRDRQVKWISPEQMDFLLSQKLTPREGLMVCAGLYAGLRRIEVLRLTMADLYIAFQTGNLSVWAKGKVRPVPVHPDLRMAIEVYLGSVDHGPGEKALQIHEDTYNRIMKSLEQRTGVPCASNVLRRSFLRFLNKKGVPLATISAIAGHSTSEMTLRYIGSPMDEMQEAILQIPSRHVRPTVQIST
jgi:integrase/recombinase XerD